MNPQITWWDGPGDWPNPIPYTGYQDLGLLPDGCAVTEQGISVTVDDAANAVEDTRVPVELVGVFNNFPKWVQNKYTDLGSDMPIANWEEAWLIRAEVEGGETAINLVNEIREHHGLPTVTYLSADDADGIRQMITEERRRSLFLEGRFWSTKIRERLWFPRGYGVTPYSVAYQDGIRMVMPTSEFELNEHLQVSQRGTLCAPEERPNI